MRHRIARLAGLLPVLLLELVLPGPGRRRRPAGVPETAPCATEPTTRHTGAPTPRGEDNALVRLYLLAHERREEAGRQRTRRRTLRFAAHGDDLGPLAPHPVVEAAR
ncbi:hypothetical protein [Streptomyces sp. SAI-229]|uniref:hypothetical protein n=1 Tax=Streptomyces sp. SAI-229 TaxID=3377731 RepID=UPI003C7C545D